MMKIELSLSTVHGTDRGGEDLSVEVLATSTAEPTPALLQSWFEASWKECLEGLPTSQADADERDAEIWLEGDRVTSYETEYGFKVNWSLAELREKVAKVVLEGDWVKKLRTRQYEVCAEIFVDGNAD